VSGPALTIIKYVFLALLYLFFARVIRAVWTEVREPVIVVGPEGSLAGPVAGSRRRRRRGAPATEVEPELVALEPEELRGQVFRVGHELTVGRAPGCGISLTGDTFVSQVHARLFTRDHEVWLEDLGSTNGTLLNGAKVTAPQPVQPGDHLQIGRTVLQLRR
jgi:hypothetical protein